MTEKVNTSLSLPLSALSVPRLAKCNLTGIQGTFIG
jgi:hypothetical protein